jgi:predicted oxidoreductase
MQRLRLSPQGPEFSRLVYGTWRFLDDPSGADPEDLLKRLRKCLDLGITTLDTAEIYGVYRVEEFLGDTLRKDPGLRSKFEIVTKFGIYIPCDFHPERKVAHYNATAARKSLCACWAWSNWTCCWCTGRTG